MQPWQPNPQFPVQLPIAADARIVPLEYTNDQVWELCLGGGDPPALSLQTTYGLRARQMRLLYQFAIERRVVSDLVDYAAPPTLDRIYPNYLRLTARPAENLRVQMEFWCPSSTLLCGRLKFTNTGEQTVTTGFRAAAQLTPMEEGEKMANRQAGINQVLAGRTGNLNPLFFITGGPEPSSGAVPGLGLEMQLPPGMERLVTWSLASEASFEQSLDKARRMAAADWESNLARIEKLNESGSFQIATGNPQHDLALHLSQVRAASLYMRSPKIRQEAISLVANRLPDTGFSRRGDGSDYPEGWKAVSTLETTHFLRCAGQSSPQECAGLLKSALSKTPEGLPEMRPGLVDFRSRLLAQPTLLAAAASLPEETRASLLDAETIQTLAAWLLAWFDQDADHDGWPEWQSPTQTGFPTPIFDRFLPNAQAAPAASIEAPSLAGLLLNEINLLYSLCPANLRHLLPQPLNEKARQLQTSLAKDWQAKKRLTYRDRDSHASPAGLILAEASQDASLRVRKKLPFPQRLLVAAQSSAEETRTGSLTIFGKDAAGAALEETIAFIKTPWIGGRMNALTQQPFHQVERCVAAGIRPGTAVQLRTIDFTLADGACQFPLLDPNLPDSLRAPAVDLLKEQLGQPGGASQFFSLPGADELTITPMFSAWLVDLLLRQDERLLAVKVYQQFLDFTARAVETTGLPWSEYRASDGNPGGERGGLASLLPLHSLLRLLGVQSFSGSQVVLDGLSCLPGTIHLNYRLWQCEFTAQSTTLRCGDSPPVIIQEPGIHRVVFEKNVV